MLDEEKWATYGIENIEQLKFYVQMQDFDAYDISEPKQSKKQIAVKVIKQIKKRNSDL